MSLKNIAIVTASAADIIPVIPNTDPLSIYDILLLKATGSIGQQNNTIVDSSNNNYAVNKAGNVKQGSFTSFGDNWSTFFDAGCHLTVSTSDSYSISSFCVELFVIPAIANQTCILFSKSNSTTTRSFYINLVSGVPKFSVSSNGTTNDIASSVGTAGALAIGQVSHIAISRVGNVFTLWVNGVNSGTVTNSGSVFGGSSNYSVAAYGDGSTSGTKFKGHLSNIRCILGYSPYSASFTPPTEKLTAITNTVLLLLATNRFKDESILNRTITVGSGIPIVKPFSPFIQATRYSTTIHGGSLFFDGTGDYLWLDDNVNLRPGTGDFTIRFWFYNPVADYQAHLYNKGNGIQIFLSGTSLSCQLSDNNTTTYFINNVGIASVVKNTWNHVELVKSGTSYFMFLNGTKYTLGTSSSVPDTGTDPVRLGTSNVNTNSLQKAYMCDVEFIKGLALHTAAFTPPTVPSTLSGDTQLLLKAINSSIVDYARWNNIETVGNIQVSAAHVQYNAKNILADGIGDELYLSGLYSYNFGDMDFTIEAIVYPQTQLVGINMILQLGNFAIYSNAGNLSCVIQGAVVLGSAGALTLNVHQHIAITRIGTTYRAFINGILVWTTTDSRTGATQSGNANIASRGGTEFWIGHIEDLRVRIGIGCYSVNFTPPTAAL